jgi:hypothetical protein
MTKGMRGIVRVSVITAAFAAGYLSGTLGQAAPAQAQMGDMMKKAGEAAGQQGGALGTAAKLGTTISEMQTHVSELQKNIDTLNQIKAALGG